MNFDEYQAEAIRTMPKGWAANIELYRAVFALGLAGDTTPAQVTLAPREHWRQAGTTRVAHLVRPSIGSTDHFDANEPSACGLRRGAVAWMPMSKTARRCRRCQKIAAAARCAWAVGDVTLSVTKSG